MTSLQTTADVVIVGAGISGLVAATSLCAGGARVVCLEARERVGGRTLSTEDGLDLGATWFWDGEESVAAAVASLGLGVFPQEIRGDALFEQADGAVARLDGNPIDVPAWRLERGMHALARELARRLPAGVIQLGSVVGAIAFDDDGRVRVDASTGTVSGRAAVLAIPPRLIAETIEFRPAPPPDLIAAALAVPTWMADMVKAVAVFDEPFWQPQRLAGSAISYAGPFGELHDHCGPNGAPAALFGFAPAERFAGATSDAISDAFVHQLVRLWGAGASAPRAVHVVDWSREPFTAGRRGIRRSAPLGLPDLLLRTAHMDGRLVLASTETSHAFAGHVEGAIVAGMRATAQAREALDGFRGTVSALGTG